MTEEELRPLLVANGLGRVADALLSRAAPMIRVYIARSDDAAIPIGASKVGGRPDLPPGTDWPRWHESMAFIAQFNLAEVAPYDRDGELPGAGLLSFFYETDGEPLYSAGWGLPEDTDPDDYPPRDPALGWRLLYHPDDPASFNRREIPADLNARGRFPACTVRLAAETTLPDVDDLAILALDLSEEERGALIDLDFAVNRGTWEEGGHHLLGYPYSLGGSPLIVSEVASRGQSYETAEAQFGHAQVLAQATARWRLLFQIDSNEEAEMDWAGGGILHFCIERAALRAGDFSRTWLDLQFL